MSVDALMFATVEADDGLRGFRKGISQYEYPKRAKSTPKIWPLGTAALLTGSAPKGAQIAVQV